MTERTKGEINGVQILRGLAALAVVLCHTSTTLNSSGNLSAVLSYGQLGVHVFFFISGYIIIHSLLIKKYSIKYLFHFLAKRSIRVDPLYILTIILTLTSFWAFTLFPSYKGKVISFIPLQFVSHLLYITPFTKWPFYNHVFWTLCIEFQFYILIGVIYFLNNTWLFKTAFILAFSFCCFINTPNSYYLAINYAPIFGMGISLVEYQHSKKNIYVVCFLICGILTFIHFSLLLLAIILVATAIVIFSKKKYFIPSFLGEISYSLYLIHPLVLLYMKIGFNRFLPRLFEYGIILRIVELALSVMAASILYILIEKPSIRLSKKIKFN